MKEEGMAPFQGLKKEELKGAAWETFNIFSEKIREALKNVANDMVDKGYKVNSVKVSNNDIFMYITPNRLSKVARRRWKNNWAYILLGIDSNFSSYNGEYDESYSEGLHPYIKFGSRNIIPLKYRNKLRKFEFLDNKTFFKYRLTLNEVVKDKRDPKRQLNALRKYYRKSIEEFERSRIVRHLCKK
jgi:hypothetical protein